MGSMLNRLLSDPSARADEQQIEEAFRSFAEAGAPWQDAAA